MDEQLNALYRRKQQTFRDVQMILERKKRLSEQEVALKEEVVDLWNRLQDAKGAMKIEYENMMGDHEVFERLQADCRSAKELCDRQVPSLRSRSNYLRKSAERYYNKASAASRNRNVSEAVVCSTTGKRLIEQAKSLESQALYLESCYKEAKRVLESYGMPNDRVYQVSKANYEVLRLRHGDGEIALQKCRDDLSHIDEEYELAMEGHENAIAAYKARMKVVKSMATA